MALVYALLGYILVAAGYLVVDSTRELRRLNQTVERFNGKPHYHGPSSWMWVPPTKWRDAAIWQHGLKAPPPGSYDD